MCRLYFAVNDEKGNKIRRFGSNKWEDMTKDFFNAMLDLQSENKYGYKIEIRKRKSKKLYHFSFYLSTSFSLNMYLGAYQTIAIQLNVKNEVIFGLTFKFTIPINPSNIAKIIIVTVNITFKIKIIYSLPLTKNISFNCSFLYVR